MDEFKLLALVTFEVFGIVIVIVYSQYKQQKRIEDFKAVIKNSLLKGYLNDESLDSYAFSFRLKYERVSLILQRLIIELEKDDSFQYPEKIELLRQVTRIYQKTGFLSNLPDSIRSKLRAIITMNPQLNELIFQLAQDIWIFNLKDKLFRNISFLISIITTLIALWQFYPIVISLF
ncbi:hypothetical protein [Rodentibacter haemolyticus]|uniref:Uncharacterized protein n=1 Tax=Rodentibacter haemolyticus TaxID=2778911 RepID=A0ABX6UXV0_9PAST|nr:hypothetical protein [Rodentibacter haemolyticus]QPB42879.1 hypothetical protein IHV77_01765 [Rodentibacter haemolyticus]